MCSVTFEKINLSSLLCFAQRMLLRTSTMLMYISGDLLATPSIPNYRSFDFIDTKFSHSSYSNKVVHIGSVIVFVGIIIWVRM